MRHMRRLVSRPGQIVFYLTTAITKIFIALIIEITFLIFQKIQEKIRFRQISLFFKGGMEDSENNKIQSPSKNRRDCIKCIYVSTLTRQ